ncbi:MAG: GntR family transcriptional regulator [Candidatus Limnocylindria bacterium]
MVRARPLAVSRSTLAGQVYDLLLQKVLDGSLRPGERLVEAEIATTVGTSRGPVREAIGRLQQHGLVRADPFVGASIVEPDRRDLTEIYSLRSVLEGYAAQLVVRRCTHEQILQLASITDRMREARGSRIVSQLRKLDEEFHAALVRLADDRRLLLTWQRLRTQVALYLSTVEEAFHDAEAMARMHERFVDALLTGDPAAAEAQVRGHLMANGKEWTTKMRWPEPAGSSEGRGEG